MQESSSTIGQASELLARYQQDSQVLMLKEWMQKAPAHIHLKGCVGSLDALIAASLYLLRKQAQLFVLHDREEANYFLSDLQNLLPGKPVLLLPSSFKRPYEFQDIDNANVLQRAEVLNALGQKGSPPLVVTYPEALSEKVINRRSLLENTYVAKVGEELSLEFIAELLISYDFERTDFVYEAGQFAIRGGILDVFSYANEWPYRIELFGKDIDSIRTFDPVTQLSLDSRPYAPIVPDVQTRLLQEVRESILHFMPVGAAIWLKDYELVSDVLARSFERASESFEQLLQASGQTTVVLGPEALFDTPQGFAKQAAKHVCIEFGNRFALPAAHTLQLQAQPQPSFNKDFDRLAEALHELQRRHIRNAILSESPRQIERLQTIFQELNPQLQVEEILLGLRGGFIDIQMGLACFTDHQIFERYHRYNDQRRPSKVKAMTLKELHSLQVGDYVTHMDYGIGRFAGMDKQLINDREQEVIRLVYRDDDVLCITLHALHKLSKYSGAEGKTPQMSKLGSPEWENKKARAKKKVKDIARELIKLYAKRKQAPGYAFTPDSYLQAELESSFLYEDTPDQARSTQEVKRDMEQPHPMDRLVCGDVGFGKTEVAIRAAFKAAADGKQVAVLVPTTILAMQHYKTFCSRMQGLPVQVEYINRFRSTKEIRAILKDLKEGKVDILIGTHRIANQDVVFKELGLLIIDEEQKFGVKTKDKLKELKVNVDVLTLTATPIPRTLHFSLMGARDLSVISTPPPNRQPVETTLTTYSEETLRDAVRRELKRGGQVFFVHNRVEELERYANDIMRLVPDARVTYAHGQMEGARLEKIMMRFIEGEYDVLISTNIIESGLDIPNANTILVNRADMFGLSDLHQMRGRVGRSNRKAYCYLLTPPTSVLTADARKRLATLEEFSELGDGFKVAMRDLDIRGAGNLLGGEQSGFITDLGFEAYNKVLEEAVEELKEEEFRALFEKELAIKPVRKTSTSIETDLEMLIPESYVSNVSERLNLYISADKLKDEPALERFRQSLQDRFGPIPTPVDELLLAVRLRWAAQALGFEKLFLKNGDMRAYLPESHDQHYYQSEVFGRLLAYVQMHPNNCKLRETQKRLVLQIEQIGSVAQALSQLQAILA